MNSASSSTAGSKASAASQGGQQAGGAASGGASGPESGHNGSAGGDSGAEGNTVGQPKQAGAGGGGTSEPPTTSSATSHYRGGPAASGTTGSMAAVLRRKTNVCLICGIYTNLSLNIFEPRNGPNIVDVIYEKYKFRAERGDNADKHICFSCNNWLINWYSLQNTSSGSSNRTYEPAPSTSRSSSSAAADSSNNRHRGRHQQGHKPRAKGTNETLTPNDKENWPTKAAGRTEQHDQVSSTTGGFAGEERYPAHGVAKPRRQNHLYVKKTRRSSPAVQRLALRQSNGPQGPRHQRADTNKRISDDSVAVVSSTSEVRSFDPYELLVKPFESRLIQMLEGQGTSVTKECVRDGQDDEDVGRWQSTSITTGHCTRSRTRVLARNNVERATPPAVFPFNPIIIDDDDHEPRETVDTSNEIVLSFDSALSEVIDVVPSLKAIKPWRSSCFASADEGEQDRSPDPVGPLRQRLSSGVLTMSIIYAGNGERSSSIDW